MINADYTLSDAVFQSKTICKCNSQHKACTSTITAATNDNTVDSSVWNTFTASSSRGGVATDNELCSQIGKVYLIDAQLSIYTLSSVDYNIACLVSSKV